MKLSTASARFALATSAVFVLAVFAAVGCGGGTTPKCSASNCEGCCDEGGACVGVTEQGNDACGVQGAACRTCTPGNACTNGKCVGATGCGPATCDGCCSGDSCISLGLTTGAKCGSGGSECTVCPSGQSCAAGSCGGSSCNGSSCPTGCCSNGSCIQRTAQTATTCGTNGASCVACQSGQTCGGGTCNNACGNIGQACCGGSICFTGQCNGGNCTGSGSGGGSGGGAGGGTGGGSGGGAGGGGGGSAPTKGIGDACVQSSECISGSCNGGRFTGGYCTQTCTTNANCPSGAACGKDPNDTTGFQKVCLKTCASAPTNPGTCRAAYVCDKNPAVDGTSPVCTPACATGQCSTNTCDSRGFCCGTSGFACCNNTTCNGGATCVAGYCRPPTPVDAGTGFVGDPCSSTTNCNGNFCEVQVAAGTPPACNTTTCWPGGYCRPTCTSAANCPAGASCTAPELGSKCIRNCTWNGGRGDCRTGYVCDRGWVPADRAQAICIYACGSAQDCISGSSCVNGFCCGLPGYACCGGLGGTCLNGGTCNASAVCP